ncbi:hypothetical protein [Sphingosinithalassobacter sp. CS137]|nr:hypothetical protein [Sphingosinithalassobacter sp. CS137]
MEEIDLHAIFYPAAIAAAKALRYARSGAIGQAERAGARMSV